MTHLSSDFAGRLRKAVAASGKDQRAVAKRAGYSPSYVNHLCRGKKNNPSILSVACIAEALGVSPGWLAFGETK